MVAELGPEFFETSGFRCLCFLLRLDTRLFFLPLCPVLLADRLGTALEGLPKRLAILFAAICDLVDPALSICLLPYSERLKTQSPGTHNRVLREIFDSVSLTGTYIRRRRRGLRRL